MLRNHDKVQSWYSSSWLGPGQGFANDKLAAFWAVDTICVKWHRRIILEVYLIAGSLSLSLPEVYLCHCRKFIFVIAGFSRQRNLDVREQNRKNAANVQNQNQDYAWIWYKPRSRLILPESVKLGCISSAQDSGVFFEAKGCIKRQRAV
jgi:hypothetical protein